MRLLDEVEDFFPDVVADRARVKEDDDITISILDELHDLVENERLDLGVILRGLDIERRPEALAGDLVVDEIGGEHEVGRTCTCNAFGEDTVDFCCGGVGILEGGVGHDDLLSGLEVRVISSITKGVVQHGLALLLGRARDTDKVENGDVLGEGTGDAVGGAKLADTERGEEDTDAAFLDTSVSVGSIRRVQLVTTRAHISRLSHGSRGTHHAPVSGPFDLGMIFDVVEEA